MPMAVLMPARSGHLRALDLSMLGCGNLFSAGTHTFRCAWGAPVARRNVCQKRGRRAAMAELGLPMASHGAEREP